MNNKIGDSGTESFAGVLTYYTALAHLSLCNNQIEEVGTESLSGVLVQCTTLDHLDLRFNNMFIGIGAVGEGMLRSSWCGDTSGLSL